MSNCETRIRKGNQDAICTFIQEMRGITKMASKRTKIDRLSDTMSEERKDFEKRTKILIIINEINMHESN